MYTSPMKAVSLLRVLRELRGMVNVGSWLSTMSIAELFAVAELPPVGKAHSICSYVAGAVLTASVPVLTASVVIDVSVSVDVAVVIA